MQNLVAHYNGDERCFQMALCSKSNGNRLGGCLIAICQGKNTHSTIGRVPNFLVLIVLATVYVGIAFYFLLPRWGTLPWRQYIFTAANVAIVGFAYLLLYPAHIGFVRRYAFLRR